MAPLFIFSRIHVIFYKNTYVQLSYFEWEALVLRRQLLSSHSLMISLILRWFWLKCQIFMDFATGSHVLQNFANLMWKSWLLVTILSGCIAVTCMSSSSRAVDTSQQMHKLFRQTRKKHRVQVWEWIQLIIFELWNRNCRDNLLLKILLLCYMVWWDTEFHIMQMRQDIFILSLWQDNKTDINITCKVLLHNKFAEKLCSHNFSILQIFYWF